VTGAGIVLMRNLRWVSVIVAVWLSTRNVATALPDVGRRPTSPRLAAVEDQGLTTRATGVLGNTTGSRPSPSPRLPVFRGRPKLFFRVVAVPLLSVGDHALLKRLAVPTRDLPRFERSSRGLFAVGRCVVLCRFLL
jgi:hypothetical protein